MDEKAMELMKKIESMSDEEKRVLAELLGSAGKDGKAGGAAEDAPESQAEKAAEQKPAEQKPDKAPAKPDDEEDYDEDYDCGYEDDGEEDYDGEEAEEEDEDEDGGYVYSGSGSGCSDSMETGGMLLVGAGVTSGLLGLALDNKPLKTAGVVGTVLGGLILIVND